MNNPTLYFYDRKKEEYIDGKNLYADSNGRVYKYVFGLMILQSHVITRDHKYCKNSNYWN
jgi:hypothetical protein